MINANHGGSIFEKHDRDYDYFHNLNKLPKTKLMSVFCSTQTWTEGHRLRLKFVKALKRHFGNRLDWFGNGLNEIERKWDGIAPYKYHIVLENQSRNHVITEKLYDSYLGLAYPIYYGASNASDYFNPSAFSTIDICDLNGSIEKIENIINKNIYEESIPLLLNSKDLVLNEYNMFKRISNICLEKLEEQSSISSEKERVVLKSLSQFNVSRDLLTALKLNQFDLIKDRLTLYYPAQLLKKISDKLLNKYDAQQ
jgi:hypothetical protein